MIVDHLGSVRTVIRDSVSSDYIISAQYDYEPFGDVLYYSGKEKSRNTYIGKEKDHETMLGDYRAELADHGVRKYESFSGRFMQTEPLWEKYYGWSPYVYSANNPITFLDPSGKDFAFYVYVNEYGDGHTILYYQTAEGKWKQYDQGALINPIASSRESHVLNIDVPAKVTIQDIEKSDIYPEAVFFETTQPEDERIEEQAESSKVKHNSRELLYNMYDNNCTDAAVDVINNAKIGMPMIYNPIFVIDPITWFVGLKLFGKHFNNAKKQKEWEMTTSPSSSSDTYNIKE